MVLHARGFRGRRRAPQRVLRQPLADPIVYGRVVEQAQVVEPPDVAAVLGLERDAPTPALARGAAVRDEEIADGASRAPRAGGQRRRDEAVGRGIQELALPAT